MIITTFKLIGANADEIVLQTEDTTDYLLERSVSGLALPPINVNITEGAGDGGKYQSSRRLPRELDLPIWVLGTSRNDVETKLRRLGKLVSDRKGATKIQAIIEDTEAETTETFTLEGYYIGGFDIAYNDANKTSAYVPLTFKCPQPYWVNEVETSFIITDPFGTTVSETVTLNNTGDVEAYPTFEISGSITTVELSNENGSLKYIGVIGSSETITIDTFNATVVDQTGANKYENLDTAPKMFTLPVGESNFTLDAQTMSGGAEVIIKWKTRREIVF